jgi:hypothetical protein
MQGVISFLHLTFGWIPILMMLSTKMFLTSQITALKIAGITRNNKDNKKKVILDPEAFQNSFKNKSILFKKTLINLKQINHDILLNGMFL